MLFLIILPANKGPQLNKRCSGPPCVALATPQKCAVQSVRWPFISEGRAVPLPRPPPIFPHEPRAAPPQQAARAARLRACSALSRHIRERVLGMIGPPAVRTAVDGGDAEFGVCRSRGEGWREEWGRVRAALRNRGGRRGDGPASHRKYSHARQLFPFATGFP